MDNYRKKIFNNFCEEFEGCSAAELEKNNIFQYCMILNWIARPTSLKELNEDLVYIIDELYLLRVDNPLKFLFY